VHQRFSTNTFPTWDLAHPFRMIAHNGEINTLRGNVNWIRAREGDISSPLFGEDLEKIWPLIYDGQSDSASFDNALELLVMAATACRTPMMMLIPEAWAGNPLMDEDGAPSTNTTWRDDGALGRPGGDGLHRRPPDRRHARPQRPAPGALLVTDDDLVVMASEAGVLPIPESRIVKKWRLQPGKMFLIDLEQGRIVDDEELKQPSRRPSPTAVDRERCASARRSMPEVEPQSPPAAEPLLDRQQAFGYTQEDLKFLLEPMATTARRPPARWATTLPLPVLSNRNKPLFSYFKQLFAQVTNPPIDPIREEIVMSLRRRDRTDAAPRSAATHPRAGEHGQAEGDRRPHRRRVPLQGDRHHHARGRRAGGLEPRRVRSLRRRRARRRPGQQRHYPLRPSRRCIARGDSFAARLLGRAPLPGQGRPAHRLQPAGRNRRCARSAPLRPAGRLRRRSHSSLAGLRQH
jgi:hypothetical protein